jgi:hypothetical protein
MHRRTLPTLATALLLGACSLFGGDGEPKYDQLPDVQSRLYFDAPELGGAQVQHFHADRKEAGYTVERARWDAEKGATAELMLIETKNPKGLEVPDDPKGEADKFPDLVKLRASYGKLYQSNTAMGPSIWRRLAAGDHSCVIFSQRWDNGRGTPVTRTLFGYYCAPPGQPFTVQEAQAVLRHAGIRAQR